jgi:hypothetical protein
MPEYATLLRFLAERVYTARLRNGQRVLDASDFHEWLLELSKKAEEAASLTDFLLRLQSND